MASMDQVLSSLIVETLKTYKKENKDLLFVMSRSFIDRFFVFESPCQVPFSEIERYIATVKGYQIEVSKAVDGFYYVDVTKSTNNFVNIHKAQKLFLKNGTYTLSALYRAGFISYKIYKIQAINTFRSRLSDSQLEGFDQAYHDDRINSDHVVELESVVSHTFNGDFTKAVEACTGSNFQSLMGLKTLDILSLRSKSQEIETQETKPSYSAYSIDNSTEKWLDQNFGEYQTFIDTDGLEYHTWVLPNDQVFKAYQLSGLRIDDYVTLTKLSIVEIIKLYSLAIPATV